MLMLLLVFLYVPGISRENFVYHDNIIFKERCEPSTVTQVFHSSPAPLPLRDTRTHTRSRVIHHLGWDRKLAGGVDSVIIR